MMKSVLKKGKDGLLRVYAVVAALALVVLIFASFVQVVGRYIFNSSPSWTEELSRYAFIWCSCLGSAIALDNGGHAAITVLNDHLRPGAQKVLQLLLTLVILVIAVILIVMGWRLAAATLRLPSPSLRFPMAYVNVAISFAGIGMTVSSISTLAELLSRKETGKEGAK